MQRVANCMLTIQGQMLLLNKPRRGWWVAPGGKMEEKETVMDTVLREYQEETGLVLEHPRLAGIFTMVEEVEGRFLREWMLFTFTADRCSGRLLEVSAEGQLAWHPVSTCPQLPMSPMDRLIMQVLPLREEVVYGRLVYDRHERLLSHDLVTEGHSVSAPLDPDTGAGYSRSELI
jgi:8-oxo-dGTP diphosphatase